MLNMLFKYVTANCNISVLKFIIKKMGTGRPRFYLALQSGPQTHRVHIGVEYRNRVSVSDLPGGAHTTTLYVMVERVEGGVRATATLTGWADFSIRIEYTPESGHRHAVCTVLLSGPSLNPPSPSANTSIITTSLSFLLVFLLSVCGS
jgi:hypothetical protein